MALSIEASFTRTEKFLRAVVFLKEFYASSSSQSVQAREPENATSTPFSGSLDCSSGKHSEHAVCRFATKDAPVSVVFSGSRDYIFIPALKEKKTDPVYPEESGEQFVHRIEKGIYHATLFGKKRELNKIKKARVFVGGEGKVFEMKH